MNAIDSEAVNRAFDRLDDFAAVNAGADDDQTTEALNVLGELLALTPEARYTFYERVIERQPVAAGQATNWDASVRRACDAFFAGAALILAYQEQELAAD
jgi:hypothetical protein